MILNNLKTYISFSKTDNFTTYYNKTYDKKTTLNISENGSNGAAVCKSTSTWLLHDATKHFNTVSVCDIVTNQEANGNCTPKYHISVGDGIQEMSTSILCVGTGDTPVTPEDYKLAGDDTGIEYFLSSATSSGDKITYSRGVHNTTEAPIEIKEVGVIALLAGKGYSSNNLTVPVLLFRKVLDEPIILEQNDMKVITYTVNLTLGE